LREWTIALPPNTISERESLTSTKPTLAKPRTDLEYIFYDPDHMGPHQHYSRKHWSRPCPFRYQPTRQSHRLHTQSHALPPKRLILYLFKSHFYYYPTTTWRHIMLHRLIALPPLAKLKIEYIYHHPDSAYWHIYVYWRWQYSYN
jgi:hypothetical protein